MEKDFLLAPVDAQQALLLDFGVMGIRPVLQHIEEALAWLRDAKKGAPHSVVAMLNNGLRMDTSIRVSLAQHTANAGNVYFGSLESFTEHCGMKAFPGWAQALKDGVNAFTLLAGGSVRVTAAPPADLGGGVLSVDIPAGFFANMQKHYGK